MRADDPTCGDYSKTISRGVESQLQTREQQRKRIRDEERDELRERVARLHQIEVARACGVVMTESEFWEACVGKGI